MRVRRSERSPTGRSNRGKASARPKAAPAKPGRALLPKPGRAKLPRRPTYRPKPKAIVVKAAASEALDDGKLRLNRFLASSGVCSRRAADELIESGRVTVNGKVVRELGQRLDPVGDDVRVDGSQVKRERPVYVLFNKPKDVVCTNARFEARERAIDFLADVRGRIYTVGRLDADSEGLILLTNDGDFAQRVAHPRYGMPKTYAVLVRGRIAEGAVRKARGGVWLAEGKTAGVQIRVERSSGDRSYMKVTIREGRNREIRRVFARLGHPVLTLKRIRIGPLTLHGLRPGGWRFLAPPEVRALLDYSPTEAQA